MGGGVGRKGRGLLWDNLTFIRRGSVEVFFFKTSDRFQFFVPSPPPLKFGALVANVTFRNLAAIRSALAEKCAPEPPKISIGSWRTADVLYYTI